MPFFDLRTFIQVAGYVGIALVVFADTGLLLGLVLPGDSLLFTAGLLASLSPPVVNIWVVCLLSCAAAILGDSLGYTTGRHAGPRLFKREDSRWFDKKQLARAHAFFEKHGGKTVMFARFMPYIRTFVPMLAGMGAMSYRRFATYNVLGGLVWGFALPWGGYFLGRSVPNADNYLLLIIIGIMILTGAPGMFITLRENQDRIRSWLRDRTRPRSSSTTSS